MPPKQRNKAKKAERMARQYGFVQSFFDSDPELKQLFNTAVKKTYTPERFVAELRDTKWFKKNAVTVRQALMQKTADPATYKQNVQRFATLMRDNWGATFGNIGRQQLDDGELRQLAETAYVMGWSEPQIMDHLSKTVNYVKLMRDKRLGGTAAELKTKIEALGRAYGLNPGNKYIASQVERIVEGRDTFEGTATRLKEWAKREYAAYAAELDGGATIEDIAAPYINTMGELLEINPETVHARMPMIQRALKYTDEQGRQRGMSLTDFEKVLRKDKRFQYTGRAREEAMNVTENLLRDFGLLA